MSGTGKSAAYAALDAVIAKRRPDFVDLLSELVSTPSINPGYDAASNEEAAQIRLSEALASWEIASELWLPAPAELARFADQEPAARRVDWTGRPNLSATIGSGVGGRTLLLNSHVDVVGIGPKEAWHGDPFRAETRDGRLSGRGASDAKGPLCAMASALAAVRAAGVELAGAATLSSVVDEEQGGGGTLAWIGRGLTADAAVVGEPTRLAVCPATRGSRRLRLHVEGRPAHPGEAFDGVNAVLKAYLYIGALYDLGLRLDRERPHPLWRHLPVQHVFNLNGIEGGAIGTAGSVPDRCTFEMAIGATAAETLENLEAEVEEVINMVTSSDPWLAAHPPRLEWQPRRLHGSLTDPAHPFVAEVARAVSAATGRPAPPSALSGVTDMRHLVRFAGIPSVTFGPGAMAVAHGANEYIDLDEYLVGIRALARIIVAWCGPNRSVVKH